MELWITEIFECNMYIKEQEATEFECTNPKHWLRIGDFVNPWTGGSKIGSEGLPRTCDVPMVKLYHSKHLNAQSVTWKRGRCRNPVVNFYIAKGWMWTVSYCCVQPSLVRVISKIITNVYWEAHLWTMVQWHLRVRGAHSRIVDCQRSNRDHKIA